MNKLIVSLTLLGTTALLAAPFPGVG